MRGPWRALLVCGSMAAACSDSGAVPAGPGGGTVVVVDDGDDAGVASQDDDAGPATARDGAVADENCERVDVVHSSGQDTPAVTSAETPADFTVTRQALAWSGSCDAPTLTLSLSDGSCPTGGGHELDIGLSANDIEDGLIRLGENPVAAEPDDRGIRVRYTRPHRLDPSGTWGNCGSATGQIVFLEAPELTQYTVLQARFQFSLAPCDDVASDTMLVYGAFHVRLRKGLEQYCPDRTR